MKTITIPRALMGNDDLVVVEKKGFEKVAEENHELRAALKAVIAGEKALKEGKTRSTKDFLKSVFFKHAQNNRISRFSALRKTV